MARRRRKLPPMKPPYKCDDCGHTHQHRHEVRDEINVYLTPWYSYWICRDRETCRERRYGRRRKASV